MRPSYESGYQPTPYYNYHETRHAARPEGGRRYKSRWPPSPSVEEESNSLAREVPSVVGSEEDGEAKWRGTVDQYPIIEEIAPPANDERRFVLVSDPSDDEGPQKAASDRRRRSFAERGNMPHLKTDVDDPPLFTKRTSTPYAYTKSQKESLAPPAKQMPVRPKHTSSRPPSPIKNREDVFDDSDADSDTARLRTERRPARYSFVKSDLQKEDLRANVLARPAPVETGYKESPQYASSRPSSPRFNDRPSPPRSPRLPPRRPPSPSISRPSSGSGRPASPLSSAHAQSQQPSRTPITEADWHATYPPATDRSRPILRPERHDTMPVPMPHINVKSPSPARPRKTGNPLPYPVDDRLADVFMPPEEHYQHNHSYDTYTPITSSPKPSRLDSPILASPRERPSAFRPQPSSRQNTVEEIPRSPRVGSNSARPQFNDDGVRREQKTSVPLSPMRLPSCPRKEPSIYNDWYTLEGCSNFDVCPSCYEGVFADTPFSGYFSQTRRYERPTERVCDFGTSPWMRLAWLLTIKQRRSSPDLLYNLAKISERERDCPGDRELDTEHITWYGVSDPRDGVHVTNFALCPCDLRKVEELFPSMKGYFTRIPTNPYAPLPTYTCSLRVNSRRFPKYLDLLCELDTEAQAMNQHPYIHRFVQLARENAFKSECQQDKALKNKAWHFISVLPELTICQECFQELIWPHLVPNASTSVPSTIPKLFNRTIQPVPGEDPEFGSSCCLYSPRMRQVWERAVRDEDFGYLEREVFRRKAAERKYGREKRDILGWMNGVKRHSYEWDKAKRELEEIVDEWKMHE
ncbi:hypothetical protein BU23DRAFT_526137 [Bimuria novae-zelandiae CBS 107.79]|uniref:Uncharacterized protein n=1 Tax=Bimuria novae-zelandiae CBS 107.79 TaxID=1447943 RepID=A0A6A5VJ74_9PLEO|nr:hypothetical protein BU23DRAFT_526137 [Bimuria novae-zelandiae CBS 107.79]